MSRIYTHGSDIRRGVLEGYITRVDLGVSDQGHEHEVIPSFQGHVFSLPKVAIIS